MLGSTLSAKAAELGLNKEALAASSSHEQAIADEFGLGVGIIEKQAGRPRRSVRSAASASSENAAPASQPKVRLLTDKEKQDNGDADFESPDSSRCVSTIQFLCLVWATF